MGKEYFKEIILKVRQNKCTKAFDASIPKKKLTKEELDKIQEEGVIKFLMKKK